MNYEHTAIRIAGEPKLWEKVEAIEPLTCGFSVFAFRAEHIRRLLSVAATEVQVLDACLLSGFFRPGDRVGLRPGADPSTWCSPSRADWELMLGTGLTIEEVDSSCPEEDTLFFKEMPYVVGASLFQLIQ